MSETQNNVVPLQASNLIFVDQAANINGPVVQATIVYEELTGVGTITILGDNIVGGIAVMHLTPEIAEGIASLIEEFNDTVGPEYA